MSEHDTTEPQKHVKLHGLTGYDEYSFDVELGFFIAIKSDNEYVSQFTAYEVCGYDATGSAIFDSRGECDPSKVEPFLSGHIKWDGCSNWSVDGWHFCSKREAMKVGQLFEHLYNIAADVISGWDGD